MSNLQADRKKIGRLFSGPVVKVLEKTPVTPNMLTWLGSLIAVAAGIALGPFVDRKRQLRRGAVNVPV